MQQVDLKSALDFKDFFMKFFFQKNNFMLILKYICCINIISNLYSLLCMFIEI